jgi:hypothetical protein
LRERREQQQNSGSLLHDGKHLGVQKVRRRERTRAPPQLGNSPMANTGPSDMDTTRPQMPPGSVESGQYDRSEPSARSRSSICCNSCGRRRVWSLSIWDAVAATDAADAQRLTAPDPRHRQLTKMLAGSDAFAATG